MVDMGKERLNSSLAIKIKASTEEGRWIINPVTGWYVHNPDVQNKWDDLRRSRRVQIFLETHTENFV